MSNKKFTFNLYQIFENDALKDYLEHMALKGWRLVKIGSLLLRFEACKPHPIRYCVEVMEKPSVYASNQTLPLKRYREFCRDAGWNYIGTNGLLHVFCTEDTEAVPVETDAQERYERIVNACRGSNRLTVFLFAFVSLINLAACWQKGTLLCSQGFIMLILLCTAIYVVGNFGLWKRRAQISLAKTGLLPHLDYMAVNTKNIWFTTVILALCILFLLSSFQPAYTAALPYILLYLAVYLMMLFLFRGLLQWLREKKDFGRRTNILIYWGFAIGMTAVVIAIAAAWSFFS